MWVSRRITRRSKKGNEVQENRKVLTVQRDKISVCVEEMCKGLESFSSHVFVANWQYTQYSYLRDNLPVGWVLSVIDFAENYRCTYQDEIASAYYSYEQVTIIPVQVFHRCIGCEVSECDETVSRSVLFISDDLNHDHHLVRAANETLVQYLIHEGVALDHHVQFSDGCAAQFKSKGPFDDVKNESGSFERGYFGSRHGKSPCDAMGAVLKNSVTRYVKSRRGTVGDAIELFRYADENLKIDEEHRKRIPFFIDSREVSRPESNPPSVIGTRSLHSVKNSWNQPGQAKLLVRNLSCFCCPACVGGEECENSSHVDAWKLAPYKKEPGSRKRSGTQPRRPVKRRKMDQSGKSEVASSSGPKNDVSVHPDIQDSGVLTRSKRKLADPSLSKKVKKVTDVRPSQTLGDKIIQDGTSHNTRSKTRHQSSDDTMTTAVGKVTRSVRADPGPVQKSQTAPDDVRGKTKDSKINKKSANKEVIPSAKETSHCPATRSKSANAEQESKQKQKTASAPYGLRGDKKENKSQPKNICGEKKTQSLSQSSSNNKQGPMPSKEVMSLMRALIHSPRNIQLSTIKNIGYSEITAKQDLNILCLHASIDSSALALMPNDIPVITRAVFPILVKGDGNCLPRVGSLLAYGSENHHLDIRLRIATELIQFQDNYLDTDYLSRGLPKGQKLYPSGVALFSDLVQSTFMDREDTRSIYQKEIHQILKAKEFMGLWQVFALASVLKTPIFSIYPERGNPNVRKDLNRLILPRETTDETETMTPALVMWSSCREDMQDEYWVPNHFCLVLPVSGTLQLKDFR